VTHPTEVKTGVCSAILEGERYFQISNYLLILFNIFILPTKTIWVKVGFLLNCMLVELGIVKNIK
jgi:hypothetical protein